MTFQKTKIELIFSELSYLINGCAFKVHNELGSGQLEIAYQKAMEIELKKVNLNFIPKKQITVLYFDSKVSSNVPDFIVEDKIVIDLKRRGRITPDDFKQARRYLTAMDKKLALLIHFGIEAVISKRVVNL